MSYLVAANGYLIAAYVVTGLVLVGYALRVRSAREAILRRSRQRS